MKKWIVCVCCVLGLARISVGQEQLVDKTVEVVTKEANSSVAKTVLQQMAAEKVSEEIIREIIGESKLSRNRSLIQNKIVKNSPRYLPYIKAGNLVPTPEGGNKMSVQFRVSMKDLQSLLLENGLFYEQDGTPIVIPFIRFVDKVNLKSFAWWALESAEQKGFLIRANRSLESSLKSALSKSNFYLLRAHTLKYSTLVPAALRGEQLRLEDKQALANAWGAQITIDGSIQIQASPERSEAYIVQLHLTALQNLNGRVIAEVVRKIETDTGPFDVVVDKKWAEVLEPATADLSSQILEAWQKGALGASLYRLSIRGKINLPTQENLKETLRNLLKEVKDIKERKISSDLVSYEVDSSLKPADLAARLKSFEVGSVKFVLDSVGDQELTYKVVR